MESSCAAEVLPAHHSSGIVHDGLLRGAVRGLASRLCKGKALAKCIQEKGEGEYHARLKSF